MQLLRHPLRAMVRLHEARMHRPQLVEDVVQGRGKEHNPGVTLRVEKRLDYQRGQMQPFRCRGKQKSRQNPGRGCRERVRGAQFAMVVARVPEMQQRRHARQCFWGLVQILLYKKRREKK